MDNIEMIEIRLAQAVNEELEKDIKQLIIEVNREVSGLTMKLYRRVNLANDYLIIIIDQKKKLDSNGKGLGQRLKAAFREYGIINHTVWNEIANNTQLEHTI